MAKIVLNDGLILFDEVVGNVTETIDPESIGANGTATTTVTITGAAMGDIVIVAPGVDLQGMVHSAYVSDADTVTIVLFNPTAGAIDLASSEWKVKVLR